MGMFGDRLKQIIADLDKAALPAQRVKIVEQLERMEPLFNIHKRTLPVELDQQVMWGLTEDEAKKALVMLKAQEKRHPSANDHFLVYYDMVSQSATEAERSIYYNSVRPMIDIIRGGEIQ